MEAILETPENRQMPIAAQMTFAHPGGASVRAEFDWRQEGEQIWRIEAETDDGVLVLDNGGAQLSINGIAQSNVSGAETGEYPRLYAQMAELVAKGASDTDFEPLRHVADAFMLGRRETVSPF